MSFRREHTGNVVLDRIQDGLRDVIDTAAGLLTRVTAIEGRRRGSLVIPIGNADYVITPAQMRVDFIEFTGAQSANRTITFPDATNATAYQFWIRNSCTGGFVLLLKCNGGTLSFASGLTRMVQFRSGTPFVLT